MFATFCSDLGLVNIPTMHFAVDGLFDLSIDVILQSDSAPFTEKIQKIFCQDIFQEIYSQRPRGPHRTLLVRQECLLCKFSLLWI